MSQHDIDNEPADADTPATTTDASTVPSPYREMPKGVTRHTAEDGNRGADSSHSGEQHPAREDKTAPLPEKKPREPRNTM